MHNYILHLDTATKVCSVAVSDADLLIDFIDLEEESFSHGEKLNLILQELLQRSQISLKDLQAISISEGPGSYTGLRIGLATAKALCYALSLPLIAISSLESLASRIPNPENLNVLAAIDARRMEIYGAMYDREGKQLTPTEPTIVDVSSFQDFEPFVYGGDGAEKLQTCWEGRASYYKPTKSSARGQIDGAWKKFKTQNFVDVAYFEPNYLKQNF